MDQRVLTNMIDDLRDTSDRLLKVREALEPDSAERSEQSFLAGRLQGMADVLSWQLGDEAEPVAA